MSNFEVKMPKLGESITEGTIVSLPVKLGDVVKEDQILFEVTTAKVNAEVPSAVEGKIVKLLYREGDTVDVGETVLIIDMDIDNAVVDESNSVALPTQVEKTEKEIQTPVSQSESAPQQSVVNEKNDETPTNIPAEEQRWYSPIVAKLAKEGGVSNQELEQIQGTGYLGRLSKKDLKTYIEQRGKQPEDKKLRPSEKPIQDLLKQNLIIETSQENILEKDMGAVGKIIADRMVASRKTSAHVTTVIEADVTKLVNWRTKNKESFKKQEGINLTYLPAIVEAAAKALKEFPKLNASIEGYKYLLKKNINIGVAVALEDENLVVPVIHNADKLNITGIAHSIDQLSRKARSNKLAMSEIENGTFTITNFGTFKNIFATPIINQPEVAILGVGYIEKKPAVMETPEGDVIAIRHKMYLSLSYDHRLINGAVGGAFLLRIADYLENRSEI